MDLEIDEQALFFSSSQPLAKLAARHSVNDDFLPIDPSSRVDPFQLRCMKEVGELGRHSGRGGTGEQPLYRARAIAGLFE